MSGLWTVAATLSTSALWAASASATVTAAYDVEDLTARAQTIVEGRVVELESRWAGTVIITEVVVAVGRCHKGDCDQDNVIVHVVGGEVGEFGLQVEGMAQFERGEAVMLFLDVHVLDRAGLRAPLTTVERRYRLTGLAQGKFVLRPFGARTVAMRDLHHLALIGDKAGAARTMGPIDVMDLRARVHSALEQQLRVR